MDKKLSVKIYTDGACSGNPGAGGWAALLLLKKGTKKESVTVKGGEKFTTNNRMELIAVIESLKFVSKNLKNHKVDIKVFSDSSYVVNSINSGSTSKWESNGWKTTKDTDIANQDLWLDLIMQIKSLQPEFIKVKGHSDNKFNNYVDQVAVKECSKYKKLLEAL